MRYLMLSLLLLVGCAPSLNAANERGGIVDHVSGLTRASAFKLADDHCRRFGRVARISGQNALESNFSFDCIAP